MAAGDQAGVVAPALALGVPPEVVEDGGVVLPAGLGQVGPGKEPADQLRKG
ncbi:hypothetical protein ES703_124207 [subsurface metagenome]